MKKILTFPLLFMVLLSFSQNHKQELYGCDYTYIRFTKISKHNYPIVFGTVVTKDTLFVNLTDFNQLIGSLYSKEALIPIAEEFYIKAFEKVYAGSRLKREQIHEEVNFFIQDFFEHFEKMGTERWLVLANGEKVHYAFFDISGVFWECENKWKIPHEGESMTDTSIGVPLSITDKIIVPIAVSNYREKRNLTIVSVER